jgi:hypothetical protein
MTALEEQIIDFIATQTGTKRARVHLYSSLAEDIGMDGDDAVEFFEQYGKTFGVDLTALNANWEDHFLPEGWGGPPLAFFSAVGVGVIAGDLLHSAVTWIPFWAATLITTLAFYLILAEIHERLTKGPARPKLPILVSELVEAAIAGQWAPRANAPWMSPRRD